MILINHGDDSFAIARGDRIAQLVLAPVVQASWTEVEELDETVRGEGGFGSGGVEQASYEDAVNTQAWDAFGAAFDAAAETASSDGAADGAAGHDTDPGDVF